MAGGYIAIELSESDVSVANNTSVVTANVVYYGNGVSYSNYNCAVSLTLDGTAYSGTHTFTTQTARQVLLTKSKTVTHSSDGSKTVSASATFATGTSLGTLKASKSLVCTKIARASVIGTISAFDIENKVKVPYTNYASFTHRLSIVVGSTTVRTIANYSSNSDIVFTPAEIRTIYTVIGANAKSGTFAFKLETYSGSTLIGSSIGYATGTIVGLAKVKVSGTWRRACPWVKVSGTWKRAIPYTKASGTWKNPKYS